MLIAKQESRRGAREQRVASRRENARSCGGEMAFVGGEKRGWEGQAD